LHFVRLENGKCGLRIPGKVYQLLVLPHIWCKLAHAKTRKQLKRIVMERSFQKVARRPLPEAGLTGNAL
jgi:hypothetical protein